MGLSVLHVGPKTFPAGYGGVEKIVYDLYCGGAKYNTHVLADKVHSLLPNSYVSDKGFFKSILQINRLRRSLKIDLVHFHKETFIPHAIILRLLGANCVLTLHGFAWRVPRWSIGSRVLFFLLDLLAFFLLKKVIFCSPTDYRLVNKYLAFKKFVCIPNGVPVNEESFNLSNRRGGVYLGRLSPEKNILGIAEAAKKIGVVIDFYGPIDERDKEFFNKINLLIENGAINYCGAVDQDKVYSVLSKYLYLVNLSFSEGLPLAVLEGASAGLHLILSDIPAHRDLGFKDVTYFNPFCFEFNLNEINGLCHSLANIDHAKNFYSVNKMLEMHEDLYRQMVFSVKSMPC